MKTRIHKIFRHALLVDSGHLVRLSEFVSAAYTKVEFEARCSDGSQLLSNAIADITGFENPPSRKIESLTISGATDVDNSFRVEIATSFRTTATVTVWSNDDGKAVANVHELQRRISDMKPPYSVLARINLLFGTMSLWGLSSVLYTLAKMLGRAPWAQASSNMPAVEHFNAAVAITAMVVAPLYALDKLREWLFPLLFFHIGRQQENMELRKKWRWVVLSSLILGPVVKAIIDRVR